MVISSGEIYDTVQKVTCGVPASPRLDAADPAINTARPATPKESAMTQTAQALLLSAFAGVACAAHTASR
jgi:hypothetical protein